MAVRGAVAVAVGATDTAVVGVVVGGLARQHPSTAAATVAMSKPVLRVVLREAFLLAGGLVIRAAASGREGMRPVL